MQLSDFDYDLPPERIAQAPIEPRDAARLLVLDRATDGAEASPCSRLARLAPAWRPARGQSLSRAARASLGQARRAAGALKLLLLRRSTQGRWQALCRPARRLREGDQVQRGRRAVA